MNKILIIEPDTAIGLFYVRSFTLAGFNAEHEPNDTRGITALSRLKPDLVLLNLQLPARRAFNFLKVICSVPWTRSVPVVAFLRQKRVELIQEAAAYGVNECLVVEDRNVEELVKSVSKCVPPREKTKLAQIREPHSDHLKTLSRLKEISRLLITTKTTDAQIPLVLDLYRNAQEMTEMLLDRKRRCDIWMSVVLVSLLKSLHDKPQLITTSNRRTIYQSIEYIGSVIGAPILQSEEWEPSFRVLAVDDDPITSRAVKMALKFADISPDSVNDPVQALEQAWANTYDLFILDLNMPRLSGFELCREFRKSPKYWNTPTIFVTASNGFETRLKASGGGGSDFIAKPFVLTELAVKALTLLLRTKHHFYAQKNCVDGELLFTSNSYLKKSAAVGLPCVTVEGCLENC